MTPNFITLGQTNHLGIIMEIRQNILTPTVLHFKVTQYHWNHN